MSFIREHNITLIGNNHVVLHPLADQHLPLLYRWNSDLDILYWAEGDDITEPYDEETVRFIYGSVSQNAFCFLIEKDQIPVGECWLQKMNLKKISALYSADTDVRRIDYCIGEKEYWGQGIGTECLQMLLKFAFETEKTDVLYIMPYDHNLRSVRLIERAGFQLEAREPVPDSQKAQAELYYKMSKEDYWAINRNK